MSLWLTHPLFLPSLIVGVTIVLWATSLLPEFITALLFFAAAMMAKIAPPEVIFGGFASSAFWLVFSGFVLGIAIRKTGLADRAAQALSASAPSAARCSSAQHEFSRSTRWSIDVTGPRWPAPPRHRRLRQPPSWRRRTAWARTR